MLIVWNHNLSNTFVQIYIVQVRGRSCSEGRLQQPWTGQLVLWRLNRLEKHRKHFLDLYLAHLGGRPVVVASCNLQVFLFSLRNIPFFRMRRWLCILRIQGRHFFRSTHWVWILSIWKRHAWRWRARWCFLDVLVKRLTPQQSRCCFRLTSLTMTELETKKSTRMAVTWMKMHMCHLQSHLLKLRLV